jgi:hypothetical protein
VEYTNSLNSNAEAEASVEEDEISTIVILAVVLGGIPSLCIICCIFHAIYSAKQQRSRVSPRDSSPSTPNFRVRPKRKVEPLVYNAMENSENDIIIDPPDFKRATHSAAAAYSDTTSGYAGSSRVSSAKSGKSNCSYKSNATAHFSDQKHRKYIEEV